MNNKVTAALPLAFALLGGTLLTNTGTEQHRVRLAYHTVFKPAAAALSPADQAVAEENCPFGLPQKDPGWGFGPTALVARQGYALEHSAVDKVPLWVCEHIEKSELTGSMTRSDKFAPDPKLPVGQRAEPADYSGSNYDRGHMAPAGDQNSSQARKDETFYLSNMCPQVGAGLNRSVWKNLEDAVRSWVVDGAVNSEWVVTGAFFYDPKEENPATATGTLDTPVIGKDAVSVPTHFYKIVVGQTADNKLRAVAFVFENRAYPPGTNIETTIKPISWIEERTGLNFMPRLDAATEQQLEKQPGQLFE